jgi:hypothetical protein
LFQQRHQGFTVRTRRSVEDRQHEALLVVIEEAENVID